MLSLKQSSPSGHSRTQQTRKKSASHDAGECYTQLHQITCGNVIKDNTPCRSLEPLLRHICFLLGLGVTGSSVFESSFSFQELNVAAQCMVSSKLFCFFLFVLIGEEVVNYRNILRHFLIGPFSCCD